MKYIKLLIPILIACLVTPVCLELAMLSGAAGHGNYLLAKILYPYSMFSTIFLDEITVPFIILAIIQLPLYGVILGIANMRGKIISATISLTVVHSLAVVACLIFIGSNFS